MTIKSLSLRERFALGCLLLCGACNNPMPVEESMENPSGVAGSKSQAGTGAAGKPATAGASGSSSSTGTAGQPSAAGATAQAGRAAEAGAGAKAEDDVDAGSDEGGAGAAAAGSGGTAGGGGAAGAVSEGSVKPPCLKKASQLVAVGDSYLNWITHTFPDDFHKAFGGDYRMYAVGGASMASGGISGFIPDQLTQAISEDPDIIAAVMTGGGNDILIADTVKYPGSDTCKDRTDAPMDKVCQDVIANAMDTAGKLMQTSADAGVRDVVFLFYPHIPGGGFGGMNPNAILDYSLPLARDLCDQAESRTKGKLRCHFLNLVPVFEGHADWFADDGIHENNLGSAAMAAEVVKVLKEKCVAQPEASGCCTP
ncbi:MAG TPA: hypothetical protein VFN67_17585 [Polyangiales bacterium]|nr:hypothetical protein [Polyangiales bacterium]